MKRLAESLARLNAAMAALDGAPLPVAIGVLLASMGFQVFTIALCLAGSDALAIVAFPTLHIPAVVDLTLGAATALMAAGGVIVGLWMREAVDFYDRLEEANWPSPRTNPFLSARAKTDRPRRKRHIPANRRERHDVRDQTPPAGDGADHSADAPDADDP